MKKIDIGSPYKNLLPIERLGGRIVGTKKLIVFRCRCLLCGKEIEVPAIYLGKKPDCGCGRSAPRKEIKTGEKYNQLTVLETDKHVYGKGWYYRCRCDCGQIAIVRGDMLRSGETRSCGCLKTAAEKEFRKAAHEKNRKETWVDGTSLQRINQKNLQRNNTSGVPGVYWHIRSKKWTARITFQGKAYSLGYYDEKEAAIAARKEAEEKLFGSFLAWYNENKGKKEDVNA